MFFSPGQGGTLEIGVTGATGLIGRNLCSSLRKLGHRLTIFSRNPEKMDDSPDRTVRWDATEGPPDPDTLEGLEALIHLAGAPIAAGRWTKSRKQAIEESRVTGTRHLVQALQECRKPPSVFLSGSAIGLYGDGKDQELDESSPPGEGFLAEVCRKWEAESMRARELEIRVVLLRTGIVLSSEGGALPLMAFPFRQFVGGSLGSGKQYLSWIHIRDVVDLILFALQQEEITGPLNLTAPHPVTNLEFSTELGKALGRPSFCRVPALAMKLLAGEMAEELLLQGQRVIPRKALEAGYSFHFPVLENALVDLLG